MEKTSTFQFEFLHKPDYAWLRVLLQPGQTICAEASAMASMDTTVAMKTEMKGGLMSAMKRGIAGESLFINKFTAEGGPGEVCFAPGAPGDLMHYRITQGKTLFLQSAAYVASSPEVQVDMKWGGGKGFFGGMGVFLLKATGEGDLFFNSYGALIEVPVNESIIVDNGFIVAFEETLEYKVQLLNGLKTGLFGGEGFVCQFQGSGKLWMQTRQLPPFANWLWPFRPQKNRN